MLFLTGLALAIETINRLIGRLLGIAALLLILLQFVLVMSNHVFDLNSIQLQELRFYLNAAIFLGGAGYTLLANEHVRVDVIYRQLSERGQAAINLVGTILFLIPTVGLIFYAGTPYVLESWRILEGSTETGGIKGVYLLKSFILVFAALVLAQGLALAVRSLTILIGNPPIPQD